MELQSDPGGPFCSYVLWEEEPFIGSWFKVTKLIGLGWGLF